MKTYWIERDRETGVSCDVTTSVDGPPERSFITNTKALHHVVLHSPTGFETGYGGSGPADLALSILADFFHEPDRKVKEGYDSKAYRYHQKFKSEFIAPKHLDNEEHYTISEDDIRLWYNTAA